MHPKVLDAMPKLAANRACYTCGSGSRKHYVDLGIVIEYEGAVVLCTTCVGQLAALLGWITPKDAEKLEKAVAALEAQVEALTVTAGKHGRLVEALEEVHITVDDGGDGPVGEVPPTLTLDPAVA